jgi:hypothetical protein
VEAKYNKSPKRKEEKKRNLRSLLCLSEKTRHKTSDREKKEKGTNQVVRNFIV